MLVLPLGLFCYCLIYCYFETGCPYAAQDGLKLLAIFLCQPLECWDYRYVPLCPVLVMLLKSKQSCSKSSSAQQYVHTTLAETRVQFTTICNSCSPGSRETVFWPPHLYAHLHAHTDIGTYIHMNKNKTKNLFEMFFQQKTSQSTDYLCVCNTAPRKEMCWCERLESIFTLLPGSFYKAEFGSTYT